MSAKRLITWNSSPAWSSRMIVFSNPYLSRTSTAPVVPAEQIGDRPNEANLVGEALHLRHASNLRLGHPPGRGALHSLIGNVPVQSADEMTASPGCRSRGAVRSNALHRRPQRHQAVLAALPDADSGRSPRSWPKVNDRRPSTSLIRTPLKRSRATRGCGRAGPAAEPLPGAGAPPPRSGRGRRLAVDLRPRHVLCADLVQVAVNQRSAVDRSGAVVNLQAMADTASPSPLQRAGRRSRRGQPRRPADRGRADRTRR